MNAAVSRPLKTNLNKNVMTLQKFVPSKKSVLKASLAVVFALFAVYGTIAAYHAAVNYTNRRLDSFALDRVEKSESLKQTFITTQVEKIEVPVIKQSDVSADINAAIKSNLK